MNTGVIDRFTEVFTRYIDSGFGLLSGEVAFLASTLIVIDVTLAGLFWAWGAGEDVLAHLVKKTLYVGFFAFLIGNAHGEKATTQADRAAVGARANAATGALQFFRSHHQATTTDPHMAIMRGRIIQSSGSLWPPPSRPLDIQCRRSDNDSTHPIFARLECRGTCVDMNLNDGMPQHSQVKSHCSRPL